MRVTSPPRSAKEKALLARAAKRYNGTKARWAEDTATSQEVKRVREFNAPTVIGYVPAKPRGRSGCRLSHEKRLLILERHTKRVAFFAELGVRI